MLISVPEKPPFSSAVQVQVVSRTAAGISLSGSTTSVACEGEYFDLAATTFQENCCCSHGCGSGSNYVVHQQHFSPGDHCRAFPGEAECPGEIALPLRPVQFRLSSGAPDSLENGGGYRCATIGEKPAREPLRLIVAALPAALPVQRDRDDNRTGVLVRCEVASAEPADILSEVAFSLIFDMLHDGFYRIVIVNE